MHEIHYLPVKIYFNYSTPQMKSYLEKKFKVSKEKYSKVSVITFRLLTYLEC